MKKTIFIIIMLILIPINVFAVNQDFKVGYDLNQSICTKDTSNGGYQDRNISTSGIAYFSYCMQAVCNNKKYTLNYHDIYSKESINCLNGNQNPYAELYKNGCSNYNSCSKKGEIKYCSTIIKYDCTRKSDGTYFTTTTTTVTTTTKKKTKKTTSATTTTTTTTIAPISTKLNSITLSHGTINFNSDMYEYSISINEGINSIDVTAIPEDNRATVEVLDNTNITEGSIITIKVKGLDGNESIYKINVSINKPLSNNSKLSSLSISGYELSFNNKINDYTLLIDSETSSLAINYVTEDEKANVRIEGNDNLSNGSQIKIIVTAEDGTESNYFINIMQKEKSNALGILFIIILILALLAGAYYIYIKFIGSKKGEKYEYE